MIMSGNMVAARACPPAAQSARSGMNETARAIGTTRRKLRIGDWAYRFSSTAVAAAASKPRSVKAISGPGVRGWKPCTLVRDTVIARITRTIETATIAAIAVLRANAPRAALLAAARVLFAELGANASVDEIARRSGIAKGTFFRHFSTKEDLIQALVADRLVRLGEVAHEINTTREPGWNTLGLMTERLLEQIEDDRLLAEFVERRRHSTPSDEIMHAVQTLAAEVDRALSGAQERGDVRADVIERDVAEILFMIARATAPHRATQPTLGRRYLRLFLDGVRAGHTSDLGDPPGHQN